MPREVRKGPIAMEQFFSAIYGLRNIAGDLIEKYFDGEITLWFSFELVSFGGEIHFYIRTPSKHAGVVSANLYANYPTLEIEKVPDYIDKFPATVSGLYAKNMNLWGTELKLGKEDAYPIRTYSQYEAFYEERSLDPIASTLEVFSKLDRKENLLFQILVRPTDDGWKKRGEALVKKMSADIKAGFERTPGQTNILKSIESNVAKQGFETLIRYIYMADRSVFDINFAKRGTLIGLNQYSGLDLNYFMHNLKIYTQVRWIYFPYFFPRGRLEARKARLLHSFRERRIPEETTVARLMTAHYFHFNFSQRFFVLNTEELATLYHPPTNLVVTGPLLQRVESKKMGPSSGLPIYKEEG